MLLSRVGNLRCRVNRSLLQCFEPVGYLSGLLRNDSLISGISAPVIFVPIASDGILLFLWCSAADSHHLLVMIVVGASLLCGVVGVLEGLAACRLVDKLSLNFKIIQSIEHVWLTLMPVESCLLGHRCSPLGCAAKYSNSVLPLSAPSDIVDFSSLLVFVLQLFLCDSLFLFSHCLCSGWTCLVCACASCAFLSVSSTIMHLVHNYIITPIDSN